jgi:hypothetical protein
LNRTRLVLTKIAGAGPCHRSNFILSNAKYIAYALFDFNLLRKNPPLPQNCRIYLKWETSCLRPRVCILRAMLAVAGGLTKWKRQDHDHGDKKLRNQLIVLDEPFRGTMTTWQKEK